MDEPLLAIEALEMALQKKPNLQQTIDAKFALATVRVKIANTSKRRKQQKEILIELDVMLHLLEEWNNTQDRPHDWTIALGPAEVHLWKGTVRMGMKEKT